MPAKGMQYRRPITTCCSCIKVELLPFLSLHIGPPLLCCCASCCAEVKGIITMDTFRVGAREFHSRFMLGTGKYRSLEEMRDSLEASGTQIVTVALRRLDLSQPRQTGLLDYIDTDRYTILP